MPINRSKTETKDVVQRFQYREYCNHRSYHFAMASIQASWRQVIDDDSLQRSSQVISMTDEDVLLFGGELKARQPVDNKLYRISLDGAKENPQVDVVQTASAPSPRVGSACTTLEGKTYLFSGRGGEAMAPIEENGALHVFDSQNAEWSVLTPADPSAPFPQARSYHAMVSDNNDTIFVHAGCPEKGRVSDLWAFRISQRRWTQLADAPAPARGGTSIAYFVGCIYRMNGFDGQNEQGFALDVFDISANIWRTKIWNAGSGPPPRSVSTLLTARISEKDMLVTLFGECDPSNLGHQGAGRMLDDVWAFDLSDNQWLSVEVEGEKPKARGWFASGRMRSENQVVIQGGLAEDNTRIGDVWVLSF